MKLYIIFICGLFFCTSATFAQIEAITIVEKSIKIGAFSTEELYFGFATGDKIIFSFQEKNNREISKVEILVYPNDCKFFEYNIKQVKNKTVTAANQSIYIFRFKNKKASSRICKVTIQRVPASQNTKNFNTTIIWKRNQRVTNRSFQDVLVGYDTTYLERAVKELTHTSKREEIILDREERIESRAFWKSGNKAAIPFTLPLNKIEEKNKEYKTEEVIGWAYWVGVGQEGKQAWDANRKNLIKVTQGITTYFTTPLGGLLAGVISDLVLPKSGEIVLYEIRNQNKIISQGRSTKSYQKFNITPPINREYWLHLTNRNFIVDIDVQVKISAIIQTNTYKIKGQDKISLRPKYEKQIVTKSKIKKSKVPIFSVPYP